MKPVTVVASIAAVGLAGLGFVMANTNPSQSEYEDYATEKLTEYLERDVCQKTTNFFENLIKSPCESLIQEIMPKAKDILGKSTRKQDFIVFSIYTTELSLTSFIPIYKIETVGALNNFYTYKAGQE